MRHVVCIETYRSATPLSGLSVSFAVSVVFILSFTYFRLRLHFPLNVFAFVLKVEVQDFQSFELVPSSLKIL